MGTVQRARKQKSGGFSLIEILVATVILLIGVTSVVAGLVSARSSVANTTNKSIANGIAQAELEKARALPYGKLGIQGGNPDGNLAATGTFTDPAHLTLTYDISRKITFVDDKTNGRNRTCANRKRVEITVSRPDSSETIKETTFISPPSYETIAGRSCIVVSLLDMANSAKISGLTVLVDHSTSPTVSDATNSQGVASFGNLLPSGLLLPGGWNWLTNTGTYFYWVRPQTTTTGPWSGYLVSKGSLSAPTSSVDAPTRRHVKSGQSAHVFNISMFRPQSLSLAFQNQDGVTIGASESASVTIDHPTLGSQTLPGRRTGDAISALNGSPLEPALNAGTVRVRAISSNSCREPADGTTTIPVDASTYPATASSTIPVTLAMEPTVRIHVVEAGSAPGVPISGAQVTVPGSGTASAVTDSQGLATFTCVTPGSTATVGSTFNYQGATKTNVGVSTTTSPVVQDLTVYVTRKAVFCLSGQARITTPDVLDGNAASISAATFTVDGVASGGPSNEVCVAANPATSVVGTAGSGYAPASQSFMVSTAAGNTYTSLPTLGFRPTTPTCSVVVRGSTSPNTAFGRVRLAVSSSNAVPFTQPDVIAAFDSSRNAAVTGLYPGVKYDFSAARNLNGSNPLGPFSAWGSDFGPWTCSSYSGTRVSP